MRFARANWRVHHCVAAILALSPLPAAAAAGHVHGAATLEVALDAARLSLTFESPLDNLIGFERAPRSDREKEAAQRLRQQFEKAELLFVPTPEARCTREAVKIDAPVLDGAKSDKAGHAAISVDVVFRCERPQALSSLETTIFEPYPRLTRIDVQVAAARRQTAARLTPGRRRVAW